MKDRVEKTKVKFFKTQTSCPQQELENKINEFISQFDSWFIEDIKYNIIKNFLPMTDRGEYEEYWTAMVIYRTENHV